MSRFLLRWLIVLLLLPGPGLAAVPALAAGHGTPDRLAMLAVDAGPVLTARSGPGLHHDSGACPDTPASGQAHERCCDGCPAVPGTLVGLAAPAVPLASRLPYRLPADPGHVTGPLRRPPR